MCALTFKGSSPSLALFLTCVWSLAAGVASCDERALTNLESEPIPTSNVALPLATGKPEQKPTRAAYSEPRVYSTDWHIEPRHLDLGRQKPVQMMSVLSDWKSGPLSTELPPCDSRIAESKPTITDRGVRKPTSTAVPVKTEIVQVKWSIGSSSGSSSPTCRNLADFHADQCPIVAWDSQSSEQSAHVSSDDDLRESPANDFQHFDNTSTDGVVTSVDQQSSVRDARTTAELQSLLQAPEETREVTYLTELSDLLQGESNWLFANTGLLDLAPEEGNATAGVSYLDDLNSLVDGPNPNVSPIDSHKTVVCQTYTDETQKSVPLNPGNPYTSIAPDRNCSTVGGAGVASLFKSISDVQVNGLSTDPPSRPRNDNAPTAELPRPEDRACQFMDAYAPIYYTTPVRYGATRPIRNAHTFVHRPLYYEDPNLERCGQSNGCLTTTVSTVHFVTAIAFTPYLMGATHPTTCVRSLPDCPTCHSFDCRAYWPGWSWTGAAAQAAAVTGLYFVFVP